MARRTLSTQGRIVAAGVTVAVGSLLAGVMAGNDHHADASPSSSQPGNRSTARPYDDRGAAAPGDSGFPTQPQTRTGGS